MSVRVRVIDQPLRSKTQKLQTVAQVQIALGVRGLFEPLVPFRDGTLRASAHTHSVPQRGLIIYSTPYAKAQYYACPNKTTPNTYQRWAEVGKAKYANQIKSIAAAEVRKALS